ncbi:MAG: hypothetical protein ACFFG0_04155 [Candidatus Thorarchaeota archaeon]
MKVAFDIHGSLDSDPKLVKLMESFYNTDVLIYIISGPPISEILVDLKKLDIDISRVFPISIVDYLKSKNYPWEKDNRGYWFDEELWWMSKGLICNEYDIDIIFDDKIEYSKYMPPNTRFILWRGGF